jgi:hypothetical protein
MLPRQARGAHFDASPAELVVDRAPRDLELHDKRVEAGALEIPRHDPIDGRLVESPQRANRRRRLRQVSVDRRAKVGDMDLERDRHCAVKLNAGSDDAGAAVSQTAETLDLQG